MLSTFKEDSKIMAETYDLTAYLPLGYSYSAPIQPPTNTGLKGVLRILDAHVSKSSGNVTYRVRSETIPA